jgi:hypothetical protein
MQVNFGDQLDVKIYTLDSPEARPYALEFKGSTNVLFNKERVPLNIAIDKGQMETYLSRNLDGGSR